MAEKYLFGTAHLVLFGLCPEVARRAEGAARALLCTPTRASGCAGSTARTPGAGPSGCFRGPLDRGTPVRRLRRVRHRRARGLRRGDSAPRVPRQRAERLQRTVAEVHGAPDRARQQRVRPLQEREPPRRRLRRPPRDQAARDPRPGDGGHRVGRDKDPRRAVPDDEGPEALHAGLSNSKPRRHGGTSSA